MFQLVIVTVVCLVFNWLHDLNIHIDTKTCINLKHFQLQMKSLQQKLNQKDNISKLKVTEINCFNVHICKSKKSKYIQWHFQKVFLDTGLYEMYYHCGVVLDTVDSNSHKTCRSK